MADTKLWQFMVFSSLVFIFLFLPVFLSAYYLTPNRHRNIIVLFASLLFYAWGAPRFVFALIAGSAVDYGIGNIIYQTKSDARRRIWVAASVFLNLGLLLFFKYANSGVDRINEALSSLGMDPVAWTRLALPLGISFFTFHKISYIVDIHRNTTPPARKFSTYLLYILFFPKLIAGPIVRYHDIFGELLYRRHTLNKFLSGLWRFCIGLGKKVLIANVIGQTAAFVFDGDLNSFSPVHVWLGALAYTFQIYFDFSGYSDMAIGLARMLGINFAENFNMPYISRNFTEFWRRWHISLSSFLRDYLYIPLGGNRVSRLKSYRNLWIVFLLCGMWHGDSLTFLAWGAFHGLFLTLDKLFWINTSKRLPKLFSQAVTFMLVMLGWLLFRSDTIAEAGAYLVRMLGLTAASAPGPVWADVLSNRSAAMLAAAAAFSFLPAIPALRRQIEIPWKQRSHAVQLLAVLSGLIILVISSCHIANASFNPFIYFRF